MALDELLIQHLEIASILQHFWWDWWVVSSDDAPNCSSILFHWKLPLFL